MEKLISKLKSLKPEQLSEIENYIDYVIWKKPTNGKDSLNTTTIALLDAIPLAQTKIDKTLSQKLISNFKNEWQTIRKEHVLTFWLIEQMKGMKNPNQSNYDAKRVYGDSRTGGFFEDKFGLLLRLYLISTNEELGKAGKLSIDLNSPLKVPEMAIQKPDIKISLGEKNVPNVILELKASWSKGTVKREIAKQKEKWNKVSENIGFLFIVFSASSKKSKTYSSAEYCRVICKDFTTNKEDLIKGVKPTPVNSLESIFEEIHNMLQNKN